MYRARTGRLHHVHRGVYAVGRPPRTAHERAMAVVLACGPDAHLSHVSAAAVWGWLEGWPLPPHAAVPGNRRPRAVVIHRLALALRDQRLQFGIPVTSPARTLLDWAPWLADRQLSRAVNEARLERQLTLGSLADIAQRFPRHPSSARLMWFCERGGRPTRSPWEDEITAFCADHGLPVPEVLQIVAGYEVDVLFRPERVIVELDGWEFHNDRQSFEDDRERDAVLLALGFVTVRMTKRRLRRDPEGEAERLRQILRSRRP